MRKVYDEESAKLQQTERVRARMILVATEQEANDILAASQRARSSRTLPSSSASMRPRTMAATSATSPRPRWCRSSPRPPSRSRWGDLAAVKTDYGWHIIRLEDRKQGGAQPYDQVKAAIRNVLLAARSVR